MLSLTHLYIYTLYKLNFRKWLRTLKIWNKNAIIVLLYKSIFVPGYCHVSQEYVNYFYTQSFSVTVYPSVRLQNLPWYKTGLVSRQVLHLLSKLQNWICPKTGRYKTCLVSNTKIEASIRATKPKPWQSHLTSETVEIFIQNEKAG